jgi:hypothetical protein
MVSLSSLNSILRYWSNKVYEYNDELKRLKKRHSDVEDAKNKLKSVANSNADDVNSTLKVISDKLSYGYNCPDKNSRVQSIFSGKTDNGIGDGNLSSADRELKNELNEINRRIDEIETAVSKAKSEVGSTKSAISAEESRLRKEEIK